MGSALASCAGASSDAPNREAKKRGTRREEGATGAPPLPKPARQSLILQEMAPDVLPPDAAKWSRDSRCSVRGSAESSFYSLLRCTPPLPTLSSSSSSSCSERPDSREGADDFRTARTPAQQPSDDFRSTCQPRTPSAAVQSSTLSVRSTVDLVKDLGGSRTRCGPEQETDRKSAGRGSRSTFTASQRWTPCEGATLPAVQLGSASQTNVKFKVFSLGLGTTGGAASRLSRSASEAIPIHSSSFPTAIGGSAHASGNRPMTGDFSYYGPRRWPSDGDSSQSESNAPQSSDFKSTAAAEETPPCGTRDEPSPSPGRETRPDEVTQRCTAAVAADSSPTLSASGGSIGCVVSKRPRKPPRTYSYRASTQPKRISRTTEEFVAMWDAVRRSVSNRALNECDENGRRRRCDIEDGKSAREDDDDEGGAIYVNHYATRMRGWQILSLAQDVIIGRLDALRTADYLVERGHIGERERRATLDPRSTDREQNDALIDLMLEKGDACFDAFREQVRADARQRALGHLLDALNEVFEIGSAASGRNFALTTRQCTVLFESENTRFGLRDSEDDTPVTVGDPSFLLDLYDERFGDASCAALAGVLRKYDVIAGLSLVKNGIGRAGVAHLASGLMSAPDARLRLLNLRLNPIGNGGLRSLASALASAGCPLVELVLSHTGLAAGCGSIMAEALKRNNSLRSLDISHNDVGDADCDELAAALCDNRCLRKLNLRNNSLGPRGCQSICSALASGHGGAPLTCLDVSQNRILDEGARCLSLLLSSPDCPLHELHAESCGVTAEGCSALSASLAKAGASLQKLFLSNNNISDDGLRCLSEALAGGCSSLRTLHVDLCGGSSAALGGLMRTLQTRNRSLEVLSACYSTGGGGRRCSTAAPGAAIPEVDYYRWSFEDDSLVEDVSRAREAVPGRKITV